MALLPLLPQSGPDDGDSVRSEPVTDGRTVVLRCEGLCSRAYTLDRKVQRLRAAGYDTEQIRAEVSFQLVSTPHVHRRRMVNEKGRTVVQFYVCKGCGHERVYGVEEL